MNQINPETIPVLVFCDDTTRDIRIAGLSLLDRLVVAAHRAGCGPITVVCQGPVPPMKRASALGIPVRVEPAGPRIDGRVLLAATHLLVTAADVRLLVRVGGRLAGSDGALLSLALTRNFQGSIEEALRGLPVVAAEGVAFRVVDNESAMRADRALWASMTSSADGWVDRVFNRPCGRWLSKVLVHTPVSPNTVSMLSVFIGVVAAGMFAAGEYGGAVVAALLFQVSAIVDCVDGEIARVMFKESPVGRWLDLVGDQVVHVAVFGGIAYGLLRANPGGAAGWLGLSAVTGALLSFGVILRGMRQPQWTSIIRIRRLVDGATNRDFSVLVLVLALAGKLDWFLWLAAVGSHVFWIAVLMMQTRGSYVEQRA